MSKTTDHIKECNHKALINEDVASLYNIGYAAAMFDTYKLYKRELGREVALEMFDNACASWTISKLFVELVYLDDDIYVYDYTKDNGYELQ